MLNEVSNAFDELPNDAYIREKYILGAANKSVADIPKKKHCNKRIIKKEAGENKPPPTSNLPPVIPVSRSTWRRWVNAGVAPQPVKLSVGVVAWRVGDLRHWLRQRPSAFQVDTK